MESEPKTEQKELSPVVPEEWQGKYTDLTLTHGEDGKDYLFGLDEDGKKDGPLAWRLLDERVVEFYGFQPQKIPKDEREWKSEWDNNTEFWEARLEIGRLKTRNYELVSTVDSLTELNSSMQRQIDDLNRKFDEVIDKKVDEKLDAALLAVNRRIDNVRIEPERESRSRLALVGAIGLAALAGIGGYLIGNRDSDIDSSKIEVSTKALADIEEDQYLRQGKILEELEESNETQDKIRIAEQYENRLHEKANQLALRSLNAQKYSIRISKEALSSYTPVLGNPQSTYEGVGSGGDTASSEQNGSMEWEYLEIKGNFIWHDVTKHLTSELGYHPDDQLTARATNYVLKINGLNAQSARHLPVGFSYKIPNDLLSAIK